MDKVEGEILAPMMHVIDPKFCNASAVNLLVKPVKGSFKSSTPLNVIDAGGNLIFKVVKGDSFFMSTDRLILDATDSPVALLRRKRFSRDDVWRVYRGKKSTQEAALFKVMRREDGLALDVRMTAASKVKTSQFHVGGRFLPAFYMNHSSIARVNRRSNEKEGGGLEVQVSEGVDNAFILALLVIHAEMRQWKMDGPSPRRAESDDVFFSAPPPPRAKSVVGHVSSAPSPAKPAVGVSTTPSIRITPPKKLATDDRRQSQDKDDGLILGSGAVFLMGGVTAGGGGDQCNGGQNTGGDDSCHGSHKSGGHVGGHHSGAGQSARHSGGHHGGDGGISNHSHSGVLASSHSHGGVASSYHTHGGVASSYHSHGGGASSYSHGGGGSSYSHGGGGSSYSHGGGGGGCGGGY